MNTFTVTRSGEQVVLGIVVFGRDLPIFVFQNWETYCTFVGFLNKSIEKTPVPQPFLDAFKEEKC